MIDPKKLEEIAKQIHNALPPGIRSMGEEVEKKTRQVLQAQLNKLDLVSREEFDVQTKVLLRTREKLTALEAKLAQLEQQLASLLADRTGDVGVAALFASLALVAARPGVQKAALEGVPWSAILLVTGVVLYVAMLERIGAVAGLQARVSALADGAAAALVVCYLVGFVSAFASTTGTLGAAAPVVAPLASDPSLTPLGVVAAIGVASSVVDVSPLSTSGALLVASARPRDEALFFRALLVYAAAMVGAAPLLAWLVFVRSGLF